MHSHHPTCMHADNGERMRRDLDYLRRANGLEFITSARNNITGIRCIIRSQKPGNMGRDLLCALLAFLLLLQGVHCAFSNGGLRLRKEHDDEDEHQRRRHHEEEEEEPYDRRHKDEPKGKSPFILKEPVEIVKTEAGKIQVLPGLQEKGGVLALKNIGLNFLTMEPKALLLPQFIDAPCVLYVFKGKMRLGWVDHDDLHQQDMEAGDVYVVPGGLVFYILNTDEAQRLRVFGIFDTSESLEMGHFQSFYVAGGTDPMTILSGFDREVLAASFKVSPEEVADLLNNQNAGPIIYTSSSQYEKLSQKPDDLGSSWSWMSLASQFFNVDELSNKKRGNTPKPFNLLKKKPDFENDNGRTIAVDGNEYNPLRNASVGVFAVSLKPAAVLAPHWNPRAAEVAFVTKGQGVIQISYPNGTNALNKRVGEGTVFFVPRYFPMCQIASREGPFEFVGFSTSSRPNRPQFLAGSASVLKALDKETLSTAFGIQEDRLRDLIDHQKDAVILPGFVEEDNATRAS